MSWLFLAYRCEAWKLQTAVVNCLHASASSIVSGVRSVDPISDFPLQKVVLSVKHDERAKDLLIGLEMASSSPLELPSVVVKLLDFVTMPMRLTMM